MLNKGLVSPEIVKELKEKTVGPLFKWVSPDKKSEAVIQQISHDLLGRIRALSADFELKGKALPVKEVNELIFDECVLWPTLEKDEKEALVIGAIPSVVKAIQEKSGLIDIDIFGRPLGFDQHTSVLKDFDYWGDISEEESAKLKQESPFQLFRARIGRWVFIVRPLTRLDLKLASEAEDDVLSIVKTITMWPQEVDWNAIPTGVIVNLSDVGNKVSGWSVDAEIEEL